MNLPTIAALGATLIGEADGITIGLSVVLGVVLLACGEARVHISGLREWKKQAQEQIAALQKENGDINRRADVQGQQISNILQMVGEVRADVKLLLREQSQKSA